MLGQYSFNQTLLPLNVPPAGFAVSVTQLSYSQKGPIGVICGKILKLSNKIDWTLLSSNPNAIEILAANKKKINWSSLSSNPNAIDILEANQDKIDWKILSLNPSIFILK